MSKETKKEIEQFIQTSLEKEREIDVNVLHLDSLQLNTYQNENIYSKSLLFILVLSGNCRIEINFKEYLIEGRNIILLSQGHFFKALYFSEDFKCSILYIGKDYIDNMYSTDMLFKRTKYNVRMYNIPQVILTQKELKVLKKRLQLVNDEVRNYDHDHQKELILFSIRMFFIELSSVLEHQGKKGTEIAPLSRDEIYFQKFLDLLRNHYQKEHIVEYYAQALHITPHYLTLIIKRLTGQTVSDLIFQLIFSEAKLLLQNPDITIQQIASDLNFSDQSAFGKFFKRKSKISPKEYRKSFFLSS